MALMYLESKISFCLMRAWSLNIMFSADYHVCVRPVGNLESTNGWGTIIILSVTMTVTWRHIYPWCNLISRGVTQMYQFSLLQDKYTGRPCVMLVNVLNSPVSNASSWHWLSKLQRTILSRYICTCLYCVQGICGPRHGDLSQLWCTCPSLTLNLKAVLKCNFLSKLIRMHHLILKAWKATLWLQTDPLTCSFPFRNFCMIMKFFWSKKYVLGFVWRAVWYPTGKIVGSKSNFLWRSQSSPPDKRSIVYCS